MSWVLSCVDCGAPDGTIKDRNVPVRCRDCRRNARTAR